MTILYNKVIPNTFRMKVTAAAFAEYESPEELRALLSEASLPRPLLFVGGCSNLLFTRDFPGTVVHSAMKDIRVLPEAEAGALLDDGFPLGGVSLQDEVLVEVGSGVVFDDFAAWAAAEGLWGVENLSHIPGEVGAGAVQNVGAYGVEAKDVIVRVNCIEISSGKAVSFKNSECGYGYRASNFKGEWKGRYAVTSVVFALSRAPYPHLDYGHLRSAVEAALREGSSAGAPQNGSPAGAPQKGSKEQLPEGLTPALIREVVTAIRREKLPEPERLGSAGSFFKNPVISPAHFEKILSAHRAANGPEAAVPHYDVLQDGEPAVKVPAAWLIEQCGWKGREMGGAACYSKQPLVIVNQSGSATPEEVIALENAIIASVRERFGIDLHPEVEHI